MASTKSLIDSVSKFGTVRSSAQEVVRGIAQQLEDGLKTMAFDAGQEIRNLLDQLKKDEAGIASAVVKNTVADEHAMPETMDEPVPNPINPTTVGETVVHEDLSRAADEGEVTFKAPDGVVATFDQVDPTTGKAPEKDENAKD